MFDKFVKHAQLKKVHVEKYPCLENWRIYKGIFTGLSVVYKLWKDCNFLKLQLLQNKFSYKN